MFQTHQTETGGRTEIVTINRPKPLSRWLRDRSLRTLLKNSGLLGASKGLSALAILATMALAARALGAVEIGWVILIHSYAMAASGLTHFQSWQLVIRYGNPALATGDTATFQRATSFAIALDLASGFLGMVAAMLLLPWIGGWFGIPARIMPLAMAYCLLIPTMGSAAANGVLRAFDRFDLISWQSVLLSYSRLLLVIGAYLLKVPVIAYVVIWFVTDLAGDLYLWGAALRELKRRSLLRGIRPRLTSAGLKGGWTFATSVNLTASINAVWGPMTRLLIGGLLSPAATSLYRVASSLADAAQSPTDLLGKALHPELMRLDPRSKKPWKLMVRTMALSGAAALIACLIIAVVGKPLLAVLFGPEFVPAYPVLLVLMALPIIAMLAFPMPAMFYAMGRPKLPLYANIIGVLIYAPALPLLVEQFGLTGAGAAFVLGKLSSLLFMTAFLMRMRKGHSSEGVATIHNRSPE